MSRCSQVAQPSVIAQAAVQPNSPTSAAMYQLPRTFQFSVGLRF